jgi:hypothetical protein
LDNATYLSLAREEAVSEEELSPYYNHLKIKPWEYADANGFNSAEFNIVKWLSRYKYKADGLRDLLKTRYCIDVLIGRERAKQEDVNHE